MSTVRPSQSLSDSTASTYRWINRALESLWLLTAILVPLAFLDREFIVSEAIVAYVEVPKIALLRTLVALMAVLWLIEWGIQGRLSFGSFFQGRDSGFLSTYWLRKLRDWLRERPIRWLFLAVWFFLGTTLVSTVLSGSFNVSMWGEVPGQDGYPAYTIIAYVVLFGVIATHLKTTAQLWRLIGALVVMGVLVSGYAILQHYGHDFFGLSERTGGGAGGQATSFMGNAIFSAAVMSMTIPLTLAVATLTFREPVWRSGSHWRDLSPLGPTLAVAGLWAVVLAVQLLGITFTLSRGPWVGMMAGMVVLLGLTAIFVGWRVLGRAILILGLTAVLALAALHGLGSISILGLGPWLGGIMVVAGFIGLAAVFSRAALMLVLIGVLTLAVFHGLGIILIADLGPWLSAPIVVGALTGIAAAIFDWPYLGRVVVGLGVAGAVAAAVLLAPSFLDKSAATAGTQPTPASSASASTATEVAERFSSIRKDVLSGLLAGRSTHWKGSWRLIRDRPWFDFDGLSLSWLRPVIGYGPELFRYTYLLESPSEGRNIVPLEPDHAHNFFIHQTVEQGVLGLLSSLGLFAAVFLVGGSTLLRRGVKLSLFHKLILIGLLATLAGRFLEMMVGVARVSDLTILWVVLAALTALLSMQTQDKEPEETTPRRRNRAQRNRPRPNIPSGGRTSGSGVIWRLAVVALSIGGIGSLTWVKSINNVRAAVEVGNAVESFQEGDYQTALADLDKAIELAPDASVYYNHRAGVYVAYHINPRVPPEEGCSARNDLRYDVCLAVKAHESNLEGAGRRPFYYRSRVAVARSAYNLKLDDEVVRHYEDVLALVPNSWKIRDELADAYLEVGKAQAALKITLESIAITGDSELSAQAYFLLGKAQGELGKLRESVVSLERGLELGLPDESGLEATELLAEAYVSLGRLEPAAQLFFYLGGEYWNRVTIEQLPGSVEVDREPPDSGAASKKSEVISTQVSTRSVDDLVKSSAHLERGLELGLSGDVEIQAHQTLAEVYLILGEAGLAAESLLDLGGIYRDQGNLEQSAQYLERSLAVAPSAALADQAHQALAEVYTSLGRLAEAEKHR